ncbi:MAG: hypothetical protein V3R52_06260, partial [Candidatus Neomarinimicrobiota bacterium]
MIIRNIKNCGLATFSAILTIVLSSLLLNNGIGISNDGWTYWEASVSLLNNLEFTYFGGQPLVVFTVPFPAYLSIIQALFGISGNSLIIGVIILGAATSFIWTYLFLFFVKTIHNKLIRILLPIYFSIFISFIYTILFAEMIFLPLLGLYLIILFWQYRDDTNIYDLFNNSAMSVIVLALLLMSKNSSLALL